MKKLFPLIVLALLVFSCNKETIYKENLNGDWVVYKYLLHNVDKTGLYQGNFPSYWISFTNDGKFTEHWIQTAPDTFSQSGTYSFADNDQKLVLTQTVETPVVVFDSTNTIPIDTIIKTTVTENEYTIFNLTKDHVQLRTDTSQLYMRKPEK